MAQLDRRRDQHQTRDALVVALAINSGATDAIGFLALGGAFTSVMTGNMVLLGTAVAKLDGTLASHIGTAILCYIVGCALGAHLAGTPRDGDPIWPAAITRALAVETVALSIYAIGWWSTGGHPGSGPQLALLAVNAIALGIQSSAVQRFGVPGLSTTYLTGTLTSVVIRLVSGRSPREVAHSAQILCGLIGGAAAGGLLVVHAPMLTPLVQLGSLALVLATALLHYRAVPPAQASGAPFAQASATSGAKVVVVGLGRLGTALIRRIPDDVEVIALSRHPRDGTALGRAGLIVTDDMTVVRDARLVLLALPPAAIPGVLERLAPHLGPTTIVANMATESTTPDLQRHAPSARLISAKLIGQAGEVASGSPGIVVVDFASAEEFAVVSSVLHPLGTTIAGAEKLVLDVNSAVAEEMVCAERVVRTRLTALDLPPDAIESALNTMAVGVFRAVATDSCGPFLQRFVDADAARHS